jgi:hypothetical protein
MKPETWNLKLGAFKLEPGMRGGKPADLRKPFEVISENDMHDSRPHFWFVVLA